MLHCAAILALLVLACARAPGVPAPCAPDPARSARALLDDAGLTGLRLAATAPRPSPAGLMCFEDAAMLAVARFAMEERDANTPIAAVRARRDHQACMLYEEPEAVACYMNRPGAALGLASRARPPPRAPPPAGWAFWLELPELSPRIFWVTVAPADRRIGR